MAKIQTPTVFCVRCYTTAPIKRVVPGSGFLQLLLYLFFILPGLFYRSWRDDHTHYECVTCTAFDVIPPTAPRARLLRAQIAQALGEEAPPEPHELDGVDLGS